jgi:hypothetical protein
VGVVGAADVDYKRGNAEEHDRQENHDDYEYLALLA